MNFNANVGYFDFEPFARQINSRWHHIRSLVGGDDSEYEEGSTAHNRLLEIEDILKEYFY